MVNCTTEYAENIFNFTIKYLNNTLAARKNLFKWSLSDSPSCSFCLHPETLQHAVSSFRSYLEDGMYTWRHNSVLLFIAKSFSSLQHCLVYAALILSHLLLLSLVILFVPILPSLLQTILFIS